MDLESLACPVSVISRESIRDVRRFFEARNALKLGGALHGPDSSRWPARWWDIVNTLQVEVERSDNAAQQAMSAHRP